MLRRFNVSTRVRTVLIIPMVVLVVAGAYIGWGIFRDWREAQANVAAVHALDQFRDVALAIRAEQVTDPIKEPEARAKAVAVTDGKVRDFKNAADKVDLGALPALPSERLKTLIAPDTGIDYLLADARRLAEAESPKTSNAYLWVMVDAQLFVRSWASLTPDRGLAQWLFAYDDLFTYTLAVSAEARAGRSLIGSVDKVLALDSETVSPYYRDVFVAENEYTELVRTAAVQSLVDLPGGARLDREVMNLNSVALTQEQQHPDRGGDVPLTLLNARSDLRDATKIANLKPTQPGRAPDLPTLDEWNGLTNLWFAEIAAVEAELLDGAANAASDTALTATITGAIVLGVLLFVLLIAALVTRSVVRSITRPLSHLTQATAQVRDQLPRIVEQVSVPGEGPDTELPRVPVETSDEIGRLAIAFNDVNATTIQVAQEQAALRGSIAEMFVNVARRDQVLLNRQLAFVDSLERSEEDPTVLANLFHLDHLATRMRRNAESLLVLAGIDSGRRLRESMPLSDVIRTASSEIEQYDRVELDLNVDPLMLGFNALPAAHMLAELLENASVFSEPDTPVEVSTGMDGQFVTVTVLDHGIGMTESELAAVNDKLSSTSPTDALGAQRLGLFVVSRLARRLGASVAVRHSSQGSGTETVVNFPVALFAGLEGSAQMPAGMESYADSDPSAYQQPYGDPMSAMAFDSHAFEDTSPAYQPVAEYGDSLASAYQDQDAPLAREVDLASLTDGRTDQGLPKRRSADDEAFVLPPAVMAHELPSDFTSTATGFTPTMASGSGLPNRRQSVAPGPVIEPIDFAPAAPVDPEARQSLFSGFRGWSRTQNEAQDIAQSAPPSGRSWHDEPVSVGASGYDQQFDETVGLTRRGRHSNDVMEAPSEVPYGHTESEVAAWHTGPIPVAEPADDSDWPSATWDTAPWQTGMFAQAPAALVGPQHEPEAYYGATLGEVPAAFETEAAAWAAAPEEPAWQPVIDLSAEPLAPVTGPPDPASPWSWSGQDPAQQPTEWGQAEPGVEAWQPAEPAAQWPAEPATQWPQPGPGPDWTQPQSAAEWSQWSAGPAQAFEETPAWQAESPAEPAPWQPAPPDWASDESEGWSVESTPDDARNKRGLFGRKKDGSEDSVDAAPSAWQPAAPDAGFAPGQGFTPAFVPAESAPSAGASDGSRMNLDDDVAAMLALRSDIEEQALAELSQLSAYRPSMGGSGERLTRRVPTAVPAAVPGAGATPIRRDADELRSRLASFQSGTSRGRRASLDQGA